MDKGLPQQEPSAGSSLVKLPQLDGLRAVAVSAVLLEHFFWGHYLTHALPWGWLGVRLFFVISGFLNGLVDSGQQADLSVSSAGDINGDGHLDVLVLATQGYNELVAYLGQGDRRFERHVIETRHVSFGYNQFVVHDVDRDGNLDLVIVNGNNMELKDPPLRPYHGVRVLLGDGQLGFEEAAFFPMYGALTAIVRDLDGDGDVDIAVNSLFPNWYAEEPETFDVLENVGDLRFEPKTLGGEHWGRWLRIAARDLDADGRVELFLGSGNIPGGGLHPERPRQWARYRSRLAEVPAVLALDPVGGLDADELHDMN